MMRYKPKLPVYGSSMTKEKKQEFGAVGNDYKTKQMLGGGPVERAIRADLLSLRQRYFDVMKHHEEILRRNNSTDETVHNHQLNGYTYQIFKKVYKEAKFGIIFTRAAPPSSRIDNEHYVQMIYSAALSLLLKDEKRIIIDNSGSSSNHHENEIFAVFALYTLYKTNPAPHIPREGYTSSSSSSSTIRKKTTTKNLDKLTLTPYEMEKLTILPMFETDARCYRRSYHAPIRISYQSMLLLLKVRTRSLLEIEKCQQERCDVLSSDHYKNTESEESSGQMTEKVKNFTCRCGASKDCIALIDKLITDQCFQYCEYDGPVGVEAFCGRDDYVREIILGETMKSDDNFISINNDNEDVRDHLTNKVEQDMNSIGEHLQLHDIEKSYDQYHDILGQISMNLRQKSNETTVISQNKNQIYAIQKCIEPIMKERQRRQKIGLHKKIENLSSAQNLYDGNDGVYNDISVDEDAAQQSTVYLTINNKHLASERTSEYSSKNQSNTAHQSSTRPAITFTYPASFSNRLKRGIDRALKSMILSESQTILEQPTNSNEIITFDFESALLDDIVENNNEDHAQIDADIDSDSVETIDTSYIPGSGNKALKLLLRKAMGESESEDKRKSKKGEVKRSREASIEPMISNKKKKVSKRKKILIDDDMSVESNKTSDSYSIVPSGSGKAALQNLLQAVSSSTTKKSLGVKKSSFEESSISMHSNISVSTKSVLDDNESVIPNESGKVALAGLLKKASKVS